jgi:uncharacterized secreted repeat protein (TIGR03808 family)
MRINRRHLLQRIGLSSVAATLVSSDALAATTDQELPISLSDLRGTANANKLGLRPGAVDDQSKRLQEILDRAAQKNKPVFLPPGNYYVSNLLLPSRTRLMGVPGASRLVYSGNGHFLIGENADHIEISGIVADGANRDLYEYAAAAIQLSNISHAVIDNCQIIGSTARGIQIERSAGRIERTQISGCAGDSAVYGLENNALKIDGNIISDCYGGGITVHRWNRESDGTTVTNNRITRVGIDAKTAIGGGDPKPEYFGIKVFRADNCMLSGNRVTGVLGTGIKVSNCDGVQITGNTCLQSQGVGIVCDMQASGLMLTSNLINGGTGGISISNNRQDGLPSVCTGNIVRNIETAKEEPDDFASGNGITVERDVTLSSNVIDGVERYGLRLGWGEELGDVIATGNIIRGAEVGIYVSVVEAAGSAQIADNTISRTTLGKIVGFRWSEAVTGDLTSMPEPQYSHLSIRGNSAS